jgi:hypothetical protein
MLPRRITDRDRDQFLKDGLEAAATVFTDGLQQLSRQDSRIDSEFERVDSRSFTATVYVNGDTVGFCRVFAGDQTFGRSLCLSFDSRSTNGMNEWLTIEDGRGNLLFKSHMGYSHATREQAMDEAAAANYLWEMFLSQLQSRLR